MTEPVIAKLGGLCVSLALVTVAVALAFVGPTGAQAVRWQQVNSTTVALNGRIEVGDDRLVQEFLDHGVRTFIVNSQGGELYTGISIGLRLSQTDTRVIVRGVCFSACANYIFLAAKYKAIEPGSFLGFHATANSISDLEMTDQLQAARELFGGEYDQAVEAELTKLRQGRADERRIASNRRFRVELYEDLGRNEKIERALQSNYDSGSTALIWWPSADLLRKCCKVSGVRDRARPSDRDLQRYGQSVLKGDGRFIILGDDSFPRCSRP
jgi:hypothetical protein